LSSIDDKPEKRKWPIGRFEFGKEYSSEDTKRVIEEIKNFPSRLEQITSLFSGNQWYKSYKPGALSARQLVNHLGDVYMNAYFLTKLVLTDDDPDITIYDEHLFNLLPDSDYMVNATIAILSNLLQRWVFLLRAIPEKDFKRKLYHPMYNRSIPLDELVALYAWRGKLNLTHLEIIENTNPTEFN
jgi:hypothetical protein